MYIINWSLLKNLPLMTGVSVTRMKEVYGISYSTWKKWTDNQSISMEDLIDMFNSARISISHFIVLDNNIPDMLKWEDYVVSQEDWIPIEWHNERIRDLYGSGEHALVKNIHQFAELFGTTDRQKFLRWEANPGTMRTYDFLLLVNTLKMDAKYFIDDENGMIPSPVWDSQGIFIKKGNSRSIRQQSDEEAVKHLQLTVSQKEKVIQDLTRKNLRLERELRELKNSGPDNVRSGMLAESGPSYAIVKGCRFHSELLYSLPKMFGYTKKDFCRMFGLYQAIMSEDMNIKVSKLIDICNHFRISIRHFFPPKSEPLVIHDRSYYEISPRIFVPMEGQTENIMFLFGQDSVSGYSRELLTSLTDIHSSKVRGIANQNTLMAITLADICTQFNISPLVFIKDENKKKPYPYITSQNEILMLNAISMAKELKELRMKVKELTKK